MDLNDYDIEQLLSSVDWDLSEDDLDDSDLENGLGSDDEIVYDLNIDEHLGVINNERFPVDNIIPDLDIEQLPIEIVQEDNANIFIPHCNVDVNIPSISKRSSVRNKNKLLPQNFTKQTRVCKAKDTAPKFTLAGWRKDLAYTLCKIGEVRPKKGRPSTPLQNKITSTRPQSFRPSKDVRIDQTSHWPIRMDKRGRCKYPNCKGFTNNQCSKCAIYLCNNKSHTCFESYHNK